MGISWRPSPENPLVPRAQTPAATPSTVGFVESFAFGGEAPKKQDGGEGIPVGEPKAPWALPYAVGTSDLAKTGEGGFHWNSLICRTYMEKKVENMDIMWKSYGQNMENYGKMVCISTRFGRVF